MKMARISAVALFSLLTARSAMAASPELELTKQYESLLGGDPANAQKTLTCPQTWQERPGASMDGKRKYTALRCVPTESQVYVESGKVFAIGVRLYSGLEGTTGSARNKAIKQGLIKAGCKLTDRGQASVARCPGGRALAVLDNWDSKSNTDTISMLYGLAAQLLPIMGMPVAD